MKSLLFHSFIKCLNKSNIFCKHRKWCNLCMSLIFCCHSLKCKNIIKFYLIWYLCKATVNNWQLFSLFSYSWNWYFGLFFKQRQQCKIGWVTFWQEKEVFKSTSVNLYLISLSPWHIPLSILFEWTSLFGDSCVYYHAIVISCN